jgi:leucyl/phenylalanyl-tRNA--protein transferase
MVSFPETVHISKTTRRLLRIKQFEVTFDTAFADVVMACAEPRPGRMHVTGIRPDVIESYEALHAAGLAHSVEVWDRSGNLAEGLYGVAITLSCHLQKWGFVLNDGKRESRHLSRLGFTLMPRAKFNALLAEACAAPGKEGRWAADKSIDVSQWDPKSGVA